MNSQAKAVPKPPGRRRERLDSLSKPQPRPPPQIRQNKPLKCPDPTCPSSRFTNEDDKVICESCGAVVQEYSMVTDIQFGMADNGRYVVHGHHVGADQAYNRNGMLYDRNKQTSSEEVTNLAGKRYMVQISAGLGVQQSLVDAGMQVFRLASANNFIQGRRTKSVAAVSLYVACRTQQNNTNQHMLIDFSDVLQLNVFHLGHIYKGLINMLRINPNGHIIQPINPEDLILRFSQRLEFGSETMRVANDAVRIVQRMNRDWMTPGRRPAGICGAALVLAARMNSFRRTVREVVYVVKVQEQTIFKRLDEFKVTESSGLTVEEFRTIDLERATDPPAFYTQGDGKKKRKRRSKYLEFDDDGDDASPSNLEPILHSGAPASSNQDIITDLAAEQLPTPAITQQQQKDRQSMPPPPLPIDPSLLEVSAQRLSEMQASPNSRTRSSTRKTNPSSALKPHDPSSEPESGPSPQKKRRGRPRKLPPPNDAPSSSLSTASPASESQLTSSLLDPLNLDPDSVLPVNHNTGSDPQVSANAMTVDTTQTPQASTLCTSVSMTPEIGDDEFASDPEVLNCLLTPNEVAIKTRIWTHENHDYLRAQSAKILKQRLAEENGTARIIKRRTRRRGRVGDLRAYGVGEEGGIAEGEPIAGTPEEAVKRMLGVRAYSKKLNYDVLRGAYMPSSSSSTRRSSVAGANSPGSGVDTSSNVGTPGPDETANATGSGSTTGPAKTGEADSSTQASTSDAVVTRAQQREIDNLVGDMEKEGVYDENAVIIDDDEDEEEDEEDADSDV